VTTKSIIVVFVFITIASSSVAGCTIGNHEATDYSGFYNNKAWPDRVIVKPFYKTTSDRGNDVYVGVFENATKQYSTTTELEHVKSQNEAARVYRDIVAGAISNGYVTRSDTTPTGWPNPVERWGGNKGFNYLYVTYYNSPDVKSWVVEKEYSSVIF
jgi:hypothetical protein